MSDGCRKSLPVAVLCALTLGVGRPETDDRCRKLYAEARYDMASAVCEAAFRESGDAEAGVTAARAQHRLGRHEEVLAWPARLRGTRAEAAAWTVAAGVHEKRGAHEEGRHAHAAALLRYRESGDHGGAAKALYSLFHLSWRGARHREALELAAQALEAAERAGDRAQEVRAHEAVFSALYDIGDLDGARHVLDRIEARLGPSPEPRQHAKLLVHRGVLLLDGGQLALARGFFEDALRVIPEDQKAWQRAAHLNAVQAALLTGDLAVADAHLEAAGGLLSTDGTRISQAAALAYYGAWLRLAQGSPAEAARWAREALTGDVSLDRRWQLEHRLGRAEEARGRRAEARAAYERAIAAVEAVRAAAGNDELKSWLIGQRRQPFEALFRLAVGAGDTDRALEIAERAQARALLDAYLTGTSSTPEAAAPAAKTAWSFDAARERLEAARAFLPTDGDSAAAPLPSVKRMRAATGDRVVLAYFEADGELWLMRVSARAVDAWPLGRAADLRALSEALVARPDDAEAAARLGTRLLPARALPAAGTPLHLVLDGALRGVPFAALRTRGRRLVEDHALSHLHSVSALTLDARAGVLDGPPVVIGDPRGDLPGAREEARAVAARLGVSPAIGPAATSAALGRATSAALLHVAAHTWLAPGGPWLGLADGPVSAAFAVRSRLRPRVAVLASCSSGIGRGRGDWGSWAAALLAGGARSVVTSLWSVDDAASRDFVLRFYEEGGADRPVEALARVQRAYIEAGRPPSTWAPFICFGAGPDAAPRGEDP